MTQLMRARCTGAIAGSAATSRYRARATLVFSGATALALVHALDDAFLNRQPGVGPDEHALAALIALTIGLASVIAFPLLRPGLRAGLALVFGILALVNGALHIAHIGVDGPAGSDLTGGLAAVAGLVLIGLGLSIPWRHRGERAATRRRRWGSRLVAVLAGTIVVYAFLYPVGFALVQTHAFREPIGDPPSAAYKSVTFAASDGLELSGWYRASQNSAAVILVHGGGSDRTGSQEHAELLVRHGYGVLLYDSRGRGESEGSPNGAGWGWEKDVAGALTFLGGREDVDPDRIGALGLSTGANVLIEVAGERKGVNAVVADGAGMRSCGDFLDLDGGAVWLGAPVFCTMFAAARVFSGSSPGKPLADLVARIAPTPLLLIAGGRGQFERDFNLIYAKAAREPVELWDLPDVNHTKAINERPAQYEQRVVGFFDRALLAK
jgi:fermentation-respiration switch protein FrsA (DUF1100 family)